jgi:hypothetical protein
VNDYVEVGWSGYDSTWFIWPHKQTLILILTWR